MKIDNPAFDYDSHGQTYSGHRQTDPRIADYVHKALGSARTVLNVGAGAGSYEPDDRYVVAVEPSAVMRAQRLARGKVPAINAKAEKSCIIVSGSSTKLTFIRQSRPLPST